MALEGPRATEPKQVLTGRPRFCDFCQGETFPHVCGESSRGCVPAIEMGMNEDVLIGRKGQMTVQIAGMDNWTIMGVERNYPLGMRHVVRPLHSVSDLERRQ